MKGITGAIYGVLLYDGGDRIFSEEIVRRLGNELIWKHCYCVVLSLKYHHCQIILLHRLC